MTFWLGVVFFAVGILVSVCLHEAGHLLTAKRFGMKATQYFAGFGPTLWSFRRGETEYGIKAIPAGGFVKIIGMTQLEDKDMPEEDRKRAFWRFPLWQRTVVLAAGSVTHFVLALVVFFLAAFTTGLPNPAWASYDPMKGPPVVGQVAKCVVQPYDLTPDQTALRGCRSSDPAAPARTAGLRAGDRIISVDGRSVATYGDVIRAVRSHAPGPTPLVFRRAGRTHHVTVDLVTSQRPPLGKDTNRTVTVSAIGITGAEPATVLHYSVGAAIPASGWYSAKMVTQTFKAIGAFPSKIPNLVDSIGGQKRDTSGPISVVGATRIGGEAVANSQLIVFLSLLGGLNIFIGVFNLFPLLPLDGGHVAVAWYERVRSWFAARRGRPDPGRVDYNKLLPLTYVVILAFGGLTLLTLAADIVNPIKL
ncbi:MAG: hypothetical protein QOJ60_2952 [Actinomycetota bacterium]|nr:hypothetical protein [Actinomycetota bacterium]